MACAGSAHCRPLPFAARSLAAQVRSFGVSFKDGAGDEAAAAIAVLLFGNSATELPGGYVGAELDERSPIAQVLEFPQEFVLLGRATVMIKGIAKRLEMDWSLSDRWGAVAQEAIEAVDDELGGNETTLEDRFIQ